MSWSRERVFLNVLVAGVLLAVVVLVSILFRSSFQLEKIRERSVVEATLLLATEKADRLDKRIIEQDNAVMSLTEGDRLENFGDRWLEVASVQTPSIRAVMLVELQGGVHEVMAYASRAPGPEDDTFRRLVLQKFWSDLELGGSGREALRHLHVSGLEKSYLISHWERQRAGRPVLVIAWHDIPRIVHDLFPKLYAEDSGQPSRVNVVDAQGRIVFGPPLSKGALTLGRQFATTLYKWRVNVSMTAAEELAEALQRRRMLEMGLVSISSFVVVVGLIVIFLGTMRERNLAVAKSDFIANVSHELKTPLSLVRMFSELLLEGRANPAKQKQYLEIVVTESERLSSLIDNILDFARVERGKVSFEFRDANLNEVLLRAAEVCRGRAERQNAEIVTEIGDGAVRAKVDERALEIALINLIDNALKYAPLGRTIVVRLVAEELRAVFSVIDQGPGIAKEDARRIFERFVRGTQEVGKAVRGSGIGLSLVQQIATVHGGKAWVERGQGPPESPGACFSFSVRASPVTRGGLSAPPASRS
jgi:two-component system phosphate regulon sensor histidine kinase PhoR